MVRIELAPPEDVPRQLDAYAIDRPDGVLIVVREDVTPARMVAAINRIGLLISL